jgi:putative NADH-flavin reductase
VIAVRVTDLSGLNMLRKDIGLEWSFLSPSADLFLGPRTGKFRFGANQLLTNAQGEGRISVEDYAIAMIDEVESHSISAGVLPWVIERGLLSRCGPRGHTERQ